MDKDDIWSNRLQNAWNKYILLQDILGEPATSSHEETDFSFKIIKNKKIKKKR